MSPDTTAIDPAASAVIARNLTLTGKRGYVFGPLDLDIAPGTLTVLQGPQGSGRTALLLTLAGRMKPDRATEDLWVLGHALPDERTKVQHLAAIAGFDGIDQLDGSVTVGDVLHERIGLLTPWYKRQPKLTPRRYAQLAAPVFGGRPLPALGTIVWDLDEVDALLLRITIALLQRPRLLVVDDLDQVHDAAGRAFVWQRLEALARSSEAAPAENSSENPEPTPAGENGASDGPPPAGEQSQAGEHEPAGEQHRAVDDHASGLGLATGSLAVIAAVASATEPATIAWANGAPAVVAIERSASYAERIKPNSPSEGN
ncbi:ATP-binding cassette domain-containing protein [Rarobacter faecitabidus]|uniref:AAA+ ATPase domain-containing protein n=1 Tax=Rarobacter faecitabidus TaxID=13243 RepID=A0A542ZNX5_RARFA|nr:hypothetical protein [Rarobacter faecitabidus]TQL62058.1 hypothetical protein FB461_1691 [Rarobacter faecitabidus]